MYQINMSSQLSPKQGNIASVEAVCEIWIGTEDYPANGKVSNDGQHWLETLARFKTVQEARQLLPEIKYTKNVTNPRGVRSQVKRLKELYGV